MTPTAQIFLPARDYDLVATLSSGQAFRWEWRAEGWEGVIGSRWVRLRTQSGGIHAEAALPVSDWRWLTDYLQTEVNLEVVLRNFPDDEPMRASVSACRGLRLLRQDPWECLASFLLSSSKQIVQIQQIVALLCTRFGSALPQGPGRPAAHAFPAPERLAVASEAELRECKMGFRAPYLQATARLIAEGKINLPQLHTRPLTEAREALLALPGVGPKIANCVLLFACGFQEAFPVDVWVMKALRQLYFPRRRPRPERLRRFTHQYFGPYAGYAQQYLFHYMRTKRVSTSAVQT
jgi:N-glycosylase/DNA lyase